MDLLETVVVDQLWTVAMDQGTECQTILETEGRERDAGGGREGEEIKALKLRQVSIHLLHFPVYTQSTNSYQPRAY